MIALDKLFNHRTNNTSTQPTTEIDIMCVVKCEALLYVRSNMLNATLCERSSALIWYIFAECFAIAAQECNVYCTSKCNLLADRRVSVLFCLYLYVLFVVFFFYFFYSISTLNGYSHLNSRASCTRCILNELAMGRYSEKRDMNLIDPYEYCLITPAIKIYLNFQYSSVVMYFKWDYQFRYTKSKSSKFCTIESLQVPIRVDIIWRL